MRRTVPRLAKGYLSQLANRGDGLRSAEAVPLTSIALRCGCMATADLTVISLGRADASASEYIAAIQRRLAEQDRVRYIMHAMGTSLEGTTQDILAVVGELHAVPFELG